MLKITSKFIFLCVSGCLQLASGVMRLYVYATLYFLSGAVSFSLLLSFDDQRLACDSRRSADVKIAVIFSLPVFLYMTVPSFVPSEGC